MLHSNAFPTPPKAGPPNQQYIYRSKAGEPVLVVNRYDRADGGKFFLPYDIHQKEWRVPKNRELYNFDLISGASAEEPIIVVEGEKCADALTGIGILATTTLGGSKAANKTDLSPLVGRKVFIWPDLDVPGIEYAKDVEAIINCKSDGAARIVLISHDRIRTYVSETMKSQCTKGWDAADAVEAGWTKANVERLFELEEQVTTERSKEQKGQCRLAIEPAIEVPQEPIDLWHTPEGEPYATVKVGGHFENWAIDSMSFRSLLSYQHYKAENKVLSQSALDDKKRTLAGKAMFEGEKHAVHTRIGNSGKSIYLDIGNKDWQAIAITATGWQVVDHSPVHFRRSGSTAALPMPLSGAGNVELLRKYLNVDCDSDFHMLLAWLVGCFHPSGPYPILILTGEQGSAKSTTAKVLRSLVDPASPMGRSAPRSEQDLVIAAKHNHVLAFDNLSTIKPQLADALCRIATGGGFGTRKLHSDADEVLFTACRPILLNGIPDLASRPDLADRAIIVTLPVISSRERKFEAEFWNSFDKDAPQILAGLLDAASTAIDQIGSVKLSDRPRMADFAKWVTAAEPALGWAHGAFIDSFEANRQSVQQAAIDGNPVAEAILSLVADLGKWSGTATELLFKLRNNYPMLTDDPQCFPRQPNRLSSELRRIQPLLRARNVELSVSRKGKTGARLIQLKCS